MDNLAKTGLNDMTDIPEIDELGINNNLQIRYQNEIIYTYTGSILVAVNPYKTLQIFNKDFVLKYHGHKIGTNDPHVFALAEASYRSIIDDDINQEWEELDKSKFPKVRKLNFNKQKEHLPTYWKLDEGLFRCSGCFGEIYEMLLNNI